MTTKPKTPRTKKSFSVRRRASSSVRLALGKGTVPYPKTDAEYENETKRYLNDIAQELDAERELVLPLRQKFGAEGFANIHLNCATCGWEFKATRGTNQSCQTPDQIKELVKKLVKDLNREVDGNLIVALTLNDQVGSAFRLRRSA